MVGKFGVSESVNGAAGEFQRKIRSRALVRFRILSSSCVGIFSVDSNQTLTTRSHSHRLLDSQSLIFSSVEQSSTNSDPDLQFAPCKIRQPTSALTVDFYELPAPKYWANEEKIMFMIQLIIYYEPRFRLLYG